MLSHPRKALLRAVLLLNLKLWNQRKKNPKETTPPFPRPKKKQTSLKGQQARISARMRRHRRRWRWRRSSRNGWIGERQEYGMMQIAVRKKSRLHT
jgi:hypothetical protein